MPAVRWVHVDPPHNLTRIELSVIVWECGSVVWRAPRPIDPFCMGGKRQRAG